MAFCTKCGATVADNAAFCGTCGTPQPGVSANTPAPAQSQMAENVAGLLCYLVGWITGLIFYFVDKRPFVRFHAAQSIVTFGGLQLVSVVITWVFGIGYFTGGLGVFSFGLALARIVDLVAVVLWVILMIKAYQHQRFRVPIAADLAEKIFGKL